MPKKFYTSITKANDEVKRLRSAKSRLRNEVKEAPMADSLKNFASISAGAAASGLTKSTLGEEIMGAPVEPLVGGGIAIVGYFMESPMMIYAAAGFLAPYISELTQDLMDKE